MAYIAAGNNFNAGGFFETELSTAPYTSSTQYVFKWSRELRDYDTSSYSPMLSNNVVRREDVDLVINTLKQSPLYDAQYTKCPCPAWSIAVFIPLIVFGFMGGFVYYVVSSARQGKFNPFIMPIGMVVLVVFILAVVFISRSCCTVDYAKRRAELEPLLRSLQSSVFDAKGVYLRLSTLGSYIVMELTFKIQPGVGIQPAGMITTPTYPYGGMAYQQPYIGQQPAYAPGHQFYAPQQQPYQPPIMTNLDFAKPGHQTNYPPTA